MAHKNSVLKISGAANCISLEQSYVESINKWDFVKVPTIFSRFLSTCVTFVPNDTELCHACSLRKIHGMSCTCFMKWKNSKDLFCLNQFIFFSSFFPLSILNEPGRTGFTICQELSS